MDLDESDDERWRPKLTVLGLMLLVCALGVLLALVLQTVQRDQAQGRLSACEKGGLHNIGTALDRYAKDFDGDYPVELSHLTPDYLSQIPVCPESGVGYLYLTGKVGSNTDGRFDDYYLLQCKEGHSTLEVPAGYPQYDSELGMVAYR